MTKKKKNTTKKKKNTCLLHNLPHNASQCFDMTRRARAIKTRRVELDPPGGE